jgi:hypothetical protein
MNLFATNEARKPPRIGSLAIISAAMLGTVVPALSADLPYDYPPYRPTYYRESYPSYNTGYTGCYDYKCACCGQQFTGVAERPPVEEERAPEEVVERPMVERVPVAERHWVQRDYIERRYPPARSAYSAYPGRYQHSYHCPAPCAESYPAYEPAPRRHFSYVGAYPPAPAAYEYESEPRASYRYAASSYRPYDYHRPAYEYDYKPAHEYRPVYEHEPSPRPPVGVPGGYYGPRYFK